MSAKTVLTVASAAMAVWAALVFGQDPSVDQVYREAQSGNLVEAQRMVDGVLRAHPNSAKAHFVSAELLTRQGRFADADVELRAAQRLEPGLPFTTPQAVQELERRIAASGGGRPGAVSSGVAPYGSRVVAPTTGGGVPWLTLLYITGLALLVFVGIQAMRRRSGTYLPAGTAGNYGTANPMQPSGMGAQTPFSGGIGSGILGGLATGAAVGAGMVAGEALAHRFTEGNHAATNPIASSDQSVQSVPDNMGGTDFGISDGPSSWDDNLGGGGSDWS